jgi:hypothetical protein
MSTHATITELQAMQVADLEKDLRAQQTVVRKMRIELTLNTEKDSARYRREKKHLARLQTVLSGKRGQALKAPAKTATVSAPKAKKKVSRSSK